MLSLLGILSLDWNFWPLLGIFGKYENVWNELFQFILEIRFGSVFNIYHSTQILCRTTGVGGGGAEGASAPPKVLIFWKSGKNLRKSGQNLWTFEQTRRLTNSAQKNMNSFFGGRSFFSGMFGRIRAKTFASPNICLLLAAPPQICFLHCSRDFWSCICESPVPNAHTWKICGARCEWQLAAGWTNSLFC